MASTTMKVRVSDKSGAKIGEGQGGTVRIRTAAGVAYRADLTTAELNALLKELKAEKVGGKRAEREAARAAAEAAEVAEPGDGEGGEDETPDAAAEEPETEVRAAA